MRLTGPRAPYSGPPPLPKMPPGLVDLMEGLTRDVLKHNPPNVYEFCANHMSYLLELRDGRAPKQHLTLEQKIARAQEKIRLRAEERRRKYDEEMKLLSIKDIVESGSQENNISDVSDKESVLKAPVHHEHDLVDALEVEIFHKMENDSNGRNSEVKDETAEEIFKDATERKLEDPEVQPASFKTDHEGILQNNNSCIVEDVIVHDNEDDYPIHERKRRSIDLDGAEINDNNATENTIEDSAKIEERGETEEEAVKVVDNNLSTANDTDTLLKSEGFAVKNQVNIVKLDEILNNSPLDGAEINNESIPKILINIGNDLVAITDTTDLTSEADADLKPENGETTVDKVDDNMTANKDIHDGPVTAEDKNEESHTVAQDKYLKSIFFTENRVEESLKVEEDNINLIKIVEKDKLDGSTSAAEDVLEDNTDIDTSFVDEAIDISGSFTNNVVEKPIVTDYIIDERKVSAEENIETSAVFARELMDDTAGFGKQDMYKSTLVASEIVSENTPVAEEKDTENIVVCKEKVGGEGNTDDPLKHDNDSVKNIKENIVENANITLENPSIVEIIIAEARDTKEEIKFGQELGSIINSKENNGEYVVAKTTEVNDQSNESFTHNTVEAKDTASDFTDTVVQPKDITIENELKAISTEETFGPNETVSAGKDDKSKHLYIDFAPGAKLETVEKQTGGTGPERTETTNKLDVIKDDNFNETIYHDSDENACFKAASEPTSENNVIDFKVVENPCTDNFTPNELPNGHNHDEKSDSENSAVISTSKELHIDTISTIKSSSLDSAVDSSNESLIDTETIKNAEPLERDIIPSSMDLETAAVTIQKVFRTFLFKSRGSTFDDNSNDENQTDEDKEQLELEYTVPSPILNKERRTLGINRMESVLQTVNEEKSLSLSMDDSSSLSSAATIIQSHVRGFLVRNRLNSNKTASTSLVNSDGPSMSLETKGDSQQKINKTILNIHIVPEGEHFLSRDESVLTSMELSLDGSPPSSINLHPLGYDKSERRKQLKREDAIQSISPPSNNSGKLSEDVDSVKEVLVIETQSEQPSIALIEENTNTTSRDASPIKSTTIETVVEAHKNMKYASTDSEPQKESDILDKRRSSLRKMGSDESDVVTPFEEKNPIYSDNTSRLLHSGEFHDVVLPTKVSRNDTSVGRGE